MNEEHRKRREFCKLVSNAGDIIYGKDSKTIEVVLTHSEEKWRHTYNITKSLFYNIINNFKGEKTNERI